MSGEANGQSFSRLKEMRTLLAKIDADVIEIRREVKATNQNLGNFSTNILFLANKIENLTNRLDSYVPLVSKAVESAGNFGMLIFKWTIIPLSMIAVGNGAMELLKKFFVLL